MEFAGDFGSVIGSSAVRASVDGVTVQGQLGHTNRSYLCHTWDGNGQHGSTNAEESDRMQDDST